MDKEIFLRTIFVDKLRNVDPNSLGLWGKMNVHQMAEHMVLAFKTANGKIKVEEIITPPEKYNAVRNLFFLIFLSKKIQKRPSSC